MEPAAPPSANQATTASADVFVVPPVRQTYAPGYRVREWRRRREWSPWHKSALAYQLLRPEPPRRAAPPPPTPTDGVAYEHGALCGVSRFSGPLRLDRSLRTLSQSTRADGVGRA